jgi:hypothetical protein
LTLALELWNLRVSQAEIAERCGITLSSFIRMRKNARFPPRERARRRIEDPTPKEIEEACEEIQEGWSTVEKKRRRTFWKAADES